MWLNDEAISDILADVDLPGVEFRLLMDGDRPLLQVAFEAPDADSGVLVEQRGRKWLLSRHMTVSEVVSTCLKAALTAAEHEIREAFAYRGQAVFGPHLDVEALRALAASGLTDRRAA